MTSWNDGYVQVNGIRIHYYRTGGDKPPIVLSHGATDDGLCWARLAEDLQVDYDVILVDTRGHGLSDTGNGDYSSEARMADLAGLIQGLDLDRPILGGHSMGAECSLQLVIHKPELTRGIFIEDPPLMLPGQPIFGGNYGANLDRSFGLFTGGLRLMRVLPVPISARLARRLNPIFSEDEIIPWVESKKRLSVDFIDSLEKFYGWQPSYDLLNQIDKPALLLIGDREKGGIVSRIAAEQAINGRSNVKIAHIAGAGHDVRRYDYAQYLAYLQDFLHEVT